MTKAAAMSSTRTCTFNPWVAIAGVAALVLAKGWGKLLGAAAIWAAYGCKTEAVTTVLTWDPSTPGDPQPVTGGLPAQGQDSGGGVVPGGTMRPDGTLTPFPGPPTGAYPVGPVVSTLPDGSTVSIVSSGPAGAGTTPSQFIAMPGDLILNKDLPDGNIVYY